MPWFRHDEGVLMHGVRTDDFYNIPPGTKQSRRHSLDGIEQARHRHSRHEQSGNDRPRRQPRLHSDRELGRGAFEGFGQPRHDCHDFLGR